MSQAYTNFVKGVLIGLKKVNVTAPFGKVDFKVGATRVTWHNGIDMGPAVKAMAIERGKVKEVGYNTSAWQVFTANLKRWMVG